MTAYPSWTPAPRPGIVPLHPLPFATILGRSFTALRHNPKVLLGFAVGAQAIAYLVLVLATGGVGWAAFSRLDTLATNDPDYDTVLVGSIAITAATGFVLGIAATALTVVVQGVVVADVAHGVVAERPRLADLWRRVRPAFWRLLAYTLLATLAILVVLGAVAGVIALIAVSVAGTAGIVVAVLLSLAAVLAAIPLSLWLSTKLCLVPAVLVLERERLFPAIARSWRLIRGRFWPALGVVVIVQLAFSAIAQVVSVPLSLLSGVMSATIAPTGDPDPTSVIGLLLTSVLTQVVVLLIQAVGLVVSASATTLIYVDCRMRREGLDLDLVSYVDQRQAGAGPADPYSWHIGRDVAAITTTVGTVPPGAPIAPPPPAPPASTPVDPGSPTRWTAPGGDA
ncbi:hypothetical protein [Microbacterium sp. SORGH_AS_0888]|uniref:hypothetical protein n=1 Tax=Microbacterium sp. SORGH_AS_0888 TaxID=3041791 RepID=UPI00278740E3|nr:hypothetical protein [Microbacterium sp. SORGH_AS_0888]MDQ1127919.1 hypothetical protein [Microbacterium sp. SORGH_AS_0888]